jgi:large subunit ribosomal protein L25
MATMKLKAQMREPHKKGAARRLRREGRIPGILYGQGADSVPLSIDQSEFDALLRAREGTVIIEIDVAESGAQQTIIREIQRDPVSGSVLHIDLQEISMTEMVHVEVPLHVTGTAYGVKTEGGILEHHLRRLDIKCLPTNIPSHIDVDVTELQIGKSIHVDDLRLDREKLELLTDDKAVIVSVVPPRVIKEEVAVPAEGEVEEGAEAAAEGAAEPAAESDKESS